MVQAQLEVFRHLRQLVGAGVSALSDGQLLESFAADREERAFAALLERHGRLVWSVCRNVLRHEQDAEDAFQATFLVLARKAGSIRKHESLASWLYGVAYRVALKARARAAARRARERVDARPAPTQPPAEAALRELQAILDDEVSRLPDRLRAPFVLCCLQGRSKSEAARELSWKEGTVSGRLALARAKLRTRLARRGVALSAGLTVVALTQGSARAAVPAALGRATMTAVMGRGTGPAATALAESVLRSLLATKIKTMAGLILMLAACAAGTGLAARSPKAVPQADPPAKVAAPVPDPRPEAPLAEKTAPKTQPRVDAFGDPLPPGAVARLGTTRLRHGGMVLAVAITPAGRPGGPLLASAGSDGAIHLWEPDTGKRRYTLHGNSSNVRTLAFSPDGKLLASAGSGPILLWDMTNLDRAKLPPSAAGHSADVFTLVFSRDGKTLFSGGGDGKLIAWDPATVKERWRVDLGDCRVRSLALAPDGQTLAVARLTGNVPLKGTIHLHDAKTGKELRQLGPQMQTIDQVAFSPDGLTLAAAVSTNDHLRLFEVASGAELHGKRRLGDGAYCVAFTPDGTTVIAGSHGRLRRWKVATGRELPPFEGEQNYFYSLAFTPDGKTLASGGTRTIGLWDVSTGKERRRAPGHPGEVSSLLFSPDSKRLLTGGYGPILRQWDLGTGRESGQVQGARDWNTNAVLSPDGKLLAVQGVNLVFRLIDAATGKEVRVFEGHKPRKGIFAHTAMTFAFTPDGKTLASAAMGRLDKTIRLWDVATGRERLRLDGPANGPITLAFASDGKVLASAYWDGSVSIWDAVGGKEVHRISLGGWGKPKVAFAPGTHLLAVVRSGVVNLIDAASGSKVRVWVGPQGDHMDLAFSRDGHTLAVVGSKDPRAYLYETASGKERLTIEGHLGAVKGISFAPNGRLLATGAEDTTALLWDVPALALGGQAPVAKHSPKQLDELWAAVTGTNTVAAYRAVLELAGGPEQAVPFLAKHLPAVAGKDVSTLIAQLDDESFDVREKATLALIAVGRPAVDALRQAQESGSAEVRSRARRILKQIAQGSAADPQHLGKLRALEALELIGTPEARRVLEKVAGGTPGAELTQAARSALERLKERKP